MIKIDELTEFRSPVRYQNGDNVTLMAILQAIEDYTKDKKIPAAFRNDQVKLGGLFMSSYEGCLVMYHPEHERDYIKFCIRVKHQGTYAFISIDFFGQSSQMKKAGLAEAYKENRVGRQMSYKVGSLIGQGLRTMGRSRAKLEEEEMYYHRVFDAFDDIFR